MPNQSRGHSNKNAAKVVVLNQTLVINAFSDLETGVAKDEEQRVKVDLTKPRKKRKKQRVDAELDAKRPVVHFFSVQKEDELLAAVCWILIKELKNPRNKCCLLVNTSNSSNTFSQSGPRTASILKRLRFSARCIHHKLSLFQRKQVTHQFNMSTNDSLYTDKLVVVCNKHEAKALDFSEGVLIIMGEYVDLGRLKTSRATYLICVDNPTKLTNKIDWKPYYQPHHKPILCQLMKRIRLATQIVDIAQRLTSCEQADEQWMRKLTRDSELVEDDRMFEQKSKKGRSPDHQRMEALNKKLYVLLCESIEDMESNAKHAKKSGENATSESALKLQITGVTTINASVGACLGAQRLQAATQWLDGRPGTEFGGDWSGPIRHGATKCHISLRIRERLRNAKAWKNHWLSEWCPNHEPVDAAKWGGEYGKVCGHNEIAATQWLDGRPGTEFGGDWSGPIRHGATKCHISLRIRERLRNAKAWKNHWLSEWCPNHEPVDAAKWGGEYGKVCGHNEIVLHDLRPFYPQEILNSRICSKRFPAPGNQAFDGCLEYLKLACKKHGQTMTLWDSGHFIFIYRNGNVEFLSKRFLIPSFSVKGLKWVMSALRSWTLSRQGNVSPRDIYKAIQLCCSLMVTRDDYVKKQGQTRSIQSQLLLEARPMKAIVMFAIGGCPSFWKQCVQSKVPAISQ
ncbi:hypothetical protein ABG067_005069 [Albugo candida]